MSDRVFYVSASQLNTFYQCPARYSFTRRLLPLLEDAWWIRDGTIAHKIMAGQKYENSARALRMAATAQEFLQRHKYTITSVEVQQTIKLASAIKLQRTIDAVAVDRGGNRVLLDYKFTGRQWDETPYGPAPKAHGFQAKCYLLPGHFAPWPTQIHFIVVDDERAEMYPYEAQPDDVIEVRKAAWGMKKMYDKNWMPKVRGHLCAKYCQFRPPCFDEPNWESEFEVMDNNPYAPDRRYEREKE